MVTFIPQYFGEEIKSDAERKMFDVLQNLELNNAYVLHSLGLPRHETKPYGEIDFVVVCEEGVACLEIKGGRVECQNGVWRVTDRYGELAEKKESPFSQVIDNMFSLRKVLKEKFCDNKSIKFIFVACGVVFPDIDFQAHSEEVIPEIVYDKMTSDISEYMKRVYGYWRSRLKWVPRKLSLPEIKEIVSFLRGNFSFIPVLGAGLEDVDKRLIRLTEEQTYVIEGLSLNKRLLISGKAGTGKTLLALYYSRKQAALGKKVLYLTYNTNLAGRLSAQQPKSDCLEIINIHALIKKILNINKLMLNRNKEEYFNEILPEKFYNYLKNLCSKELESLQYDVIVMDEGQDMFHPIYLQALGYLLKDGFENGQWAVFYDEKQNIYITDYQKGMDILESYSAVKFQLYKNCRNTVQIGTYCEKISGINMAEYIQENGEEVRKIKYSDDADFKKQIEELLKNLKNEQVAMKDVIFLSSKKYKNSKIYNSGIKVNVLNKRFNASKDLPVFATIHGFKGLDSKVVILFDVEEIQKKNFSTLFYIAGTRARTLLYIAATDKFFNRYKE